MGWVKLDDTHYALEGKDPQEIVDIEELQREIDRIDDEIAQKSIEYPEGISEEVRTAIDMYNENTLTPLFAERERLKNIIEDIKGGV